MTYIVDLQGFRKSMNEFVLKEISIIDANSNDEDDDDDNDTAQPLTLLFKSPCDWQSLPSKYKSVNSWLQRNFHGLLWNSGDIPYESAGTIIRAILHSARIIYVKGLEKKVWLASFLGDSLRIVDLEDQDCPSLRNLLKLPPRQCTHHHYQHHCDVSRLNCATENVKLLKKWYSVHKRGLK